MPKTHAEKFRQNAVECHRKAEEAASAADKQAWLKLAEDWGALARGEGLNQEWQGMRAIRTVIDGTLRPASCPNESGA